MPSRSDASRVVNRAQARVLWLALAAALLAATAAAIVAAASVPPAPRAVDRGTVFVLVALPMVLLDLGAAYFIPARVRQRPLAGAPPDSVAATQTVVASALALAPGLMCCALFFVSRDPLLLALVLPCAAVLLHWFPSESRWARLVPAAGRMTRE